MMSARHASLPPPQRPGIMSARVKSAVFLALYLLAGCALAQQQPQQPASKRDDLDVTMQIIVDPDAKLPDEVVRRIPLPARKPAEPGAGNQPEKPDAAAEGQERAREAKELGREMAESAKQRAQEAAEQREQARRSAAEERRRNPDPPADPPRGPPPRS